MSSQPPSPAPSNSAAGATSAARRGRPERSLRPWFDGLGLVVVLAWAVVLGQRLLMPSAGGDSPVHTEGGGLVAGDEWQGLYMGADKVGFVHIRKEPRTDGAGWKLSSEMQLRLTVMGQRHHMEVEVQAWLDPALAVQRFEFALLGGQAGGLELKGHVNGARLELQVTSAGQTRPQIVELAEPLTLELATRPLMAKQGLAVGRRLSARYFDPLTQSQRVLQAEVIGEETVAVMGTPVSTFVLRQELQGLVLRAWITAGGEVVKEELPLGLVALRETEEEARHGRHMPGGAALIGGAAGSQDMVTRSSVVAAGRLELLRSPAAALHLQGVPAAELAAPGLALDGGRQLLRGAEVTVTRQLLSEADLPLVQASAQARPAPGGRDTAGPRTPTLDADAAAALQPEPLVQSDAPALVRAAHEIVGETTGRAEAASRLVRWVHETLEKTSVIGVPSALEALQTRRGDCNEHATLFVALARAAGLPARMLAGLVYMPDDNRFFYHAWAEVQLAEGWVEVDPTFGELPASTGHLRLVRGGLMKQVELFRLIGRLRRIDVRAPQGTPTPRPQEASP